MIWITAYLTAGLLTALWGLWDIRNARKHVEDCDGHRDSLGFIRKLDENPGLFLVLTLFIILLWWIVWGMFLSEWARDDDDEDDDPQANVPPQYR